MASQTVLIKGSKILLSIFAFLCLGGCVTYFGTDGPYEGRIIDAETRQPIEGAVVHGTWVKSHPGPGGASSTYFDSKEVLTDKEGRFKIEGVGLLIMSNMEEMEINAFKAGYTQVHSYWTGLKIDSAAVQFVEWEGKKVVIKLQRMTMEERIKRSVYFPGGDVPAKNKRLLIRESNKEMIELGYPVNTLLHEE